MPIQVIQFPFPLNVSLQKGDTIYWCYNAGGQAGRNHPGSASVNTKPKKLGLVGTVNRNLNRVGVVVQSGLKDVCQNNECYFFFSKDRRANYSGIIGYFMEVEYRNYSTLKSEIFATAVDYVESSK
tara:strand:- start:53 stop:430 length:378 start_codon:yes stop_codon:yes gene_type:complete